MKTQAHGDGESPAELRLSAAHARALTSHFKAVEEYLRVVTSWVDGFEGVFYAAPAELPEEQRVRARALVSEVLRGLEDVRSELGLERQQMSSIGVMRAYLSELWVSLVETRGRYLRGYGEVPAELAEYLDRRVDELESRVNEIRRLVEVGSRREGSNSASSVNADPSEAPSKPLPKTQVDTSRQTR